MMWISVPQIPQAPTRMMADADRVPALAEVALAALAEVALAAVQRRVDPDAIADLDADDLIADINDRAAELVPDDDRVAGRRELAIDDVDIGAADAAGADLDDDVLRPGHRLRHILNPDHAGLFDYDRFHDELLLGGW